MGLGGRGGGSHRCLHLEKAGPEKELADALKDATAELQVGSFGCQDLLFVHGERLLDALYIVARARVQFQYLTFFNEERNLQHQPGFHGCRFGAS